MYISFSRNTLKPDSEIASFCDLYDTVVKFLPAYLSTLQWRMTGVLFLPPRNLISLVTRICNLHMDLFLGLRLFRILGCDLRLGFSVLLWKYRLCRYAWSVTWQKNRHVWVQQGESNNPKIHSSGQLYHRRYHLSDTCHANSNSDCGTRALWVWGHFYWDGHPPGHQIPNSTW